MGEKLRDAALLRGGDAVLDMAYLVGFVHADGGVRLLSEAAFSAVNSRMSEFRNNFSTECSIKIRLLDDLGFGHVESAFEGSPRLQVWTIVSRRW